MPVATKTRPGPTARTALVRPAPIEERVEVIPTQRIRRFQDQPRRHFNNEELRELADSIKEVGQITPILVRAITGDRNHEYELIDGERRLRACTLGQIKSMRAVVRTVVSEDEQFLHSVIANFGRVGHTPIETAMAIKRIRATQRIQGLTPTQQVETIAKMCARSTVWVYQHEALLKLDPKVLEMMDPALPKGRRLDFSIAHFITSLRPDLQLRIAREVIDKKLKIKDARHVARMVAEAEGVQAGTAKQGRKPSDDYRVTERVLEGFNRELDRALQLSDIAYEMMFRGRSETDRLQMIYHVNQALSKLTKLRGKLPGPRAEAAGVASKADAVAK
jgi:ParB/RepB/Spo0J family partition protein